MSTRRKEDLNHRGYENLTSSYEMNKWFSVKHYESTENCCF